MILNKPKIRYSKLKIVFLFLLFAQLAIRPFLSLNWLGEADQARLINNSVFALQHGKIVDIYTGRTSPLFIFAIIDLYKLGLSIPDIIKVLNLSAAMIAGVVPFLAYKIIKVRWGEEIAIFATIYWIFSYSLFIAGLYGFPHLFAFAFILFAVYLSDRKREKNFYHGEIAFLFFWVISLGIKLDLLLFAPALILLKSFDEKRHSLKSLFKNSYSVVIGACFSVLMSNYLIPSSENIYKFSVNWNQKFPFDIKALFQASNSALWQGNGQFLFLLALVGTSLLVIKKRYYSLVTLWVWILVPFIFWGLIFGNSARHLFTGTLALAILAAIFVPKKYNILWLAILLIINYVSFLPGAQGTNLLHKRTVIVNNRRLVRDYSKKMIKRFGNKNVYISGSLLPFVETFFLESASNPRYLDYSTIKTSSKIVSFIYIYDKKEYKKKYTSISKSFRKDTSIFSNKYDLREFKKRGYKTYYKNIKLK